MPNQHNADIAIEQTGSLGASRAVLTLGSRSGQPTSFEWDDLRFALAANDPSKIGIFDHFTGDAIPTPWAENLSTGATAAINAQVGGVVRLTTDTDDDDFATLARGLNWQVGSDWLFFVARVKSVTATTLRAIEIGVSDAVSETNGLAFSDHTTAGVTDVATDAAVFGFNTDGSMTVWNALAVKNGTPQASATTVAPSTSFQKFAIAISPAGTAFYYINDTLVATITNAITTSVALTPWISLKSLSGATKSIDIDYVGIVCANP